ncbi:MAG: hypothetical protein R3178_07145, partial [Rhodothermales bacterium]|nr:hypothetical protein [Rhodothermales bacterium]
MTRSYYPQANRGRTAGTLVLLMLLASSYAGPATAQDVLQVSFSEPDRPMRVVVRTIYGDIQVAPHSESNVVVEVASRPRGTSHVDDGDREGLRSIDQGPNISIGENDNTVYVKSGSEDLFTDLIVRVPRSAAIAAHVTGDGDILIQGATEEVETNAANGKITLENVSGPVVAHAHAGALKATFSDIPPGAPMAFSAWSGDVDVTFPETLAARLKMRTDYGQILS